MAKNNINMNQVVEEAVRFPRWQADDAFAASMRRQMNNDLAVMNAVFGNHFRIETTKGEYKLAFNADIDAAILVESGDVRKEMVTRMAAVNAACTRAKSAKKALFDLLPDRKLMELAIADKAQGRGEDMLTACWAKFLLNLGVDPASLSEAAVDKFVTRMLPLMNTIRVTRRNATLTVGTRQQSVNQLGLDMWTALTIYLTEGLVTDVLDTNGNFTYVVKDGKKTRKHVQKLFGGQYVFTGTKYVRKDAPTAPIAFEDEEI